MPVIRLSDSIGAGVIISCPTGILISNQTGGMSCLRPECEGVFAPLGNDYRLPDGPLISPEVKLAAHFEGPKYGGSGATGGLDEGDADHVDSVLREFKLDGTVRVDRSRLRDSHEAWVYIVITADDSAFSGFSPYPRQGILTWCGSD